MILNCDANVSIVFVVREDEHFEKAAVRHEGPLKHVSNHVHDDSLFNRPTHHGTRRSGQQQPCALAPGLHRRMEPLSFPRSQPTDD